MKGLAERVAKAFCGYVKDSDRNMEATVDGGGLGRAVSGIVSVNDRGRVDGNARESWSDRSGFWESGVKKDAERGFRFRQVRGGACFRQETCLA